MEEQLEGILKQIIKNGADKKRKLSIEHNIGQSDPSYKFNTSSDEIFMPSDELYVSEDEELVEDLYQLMQGYSVSLWTKKDSENRIAWKNHDERVEQTDKFYKSMTISDTLAIEAHNGTQVYDVLGRIIQPGDKPTLREGEAFSSVLSELKDTTERRVHELINTYENIRKERVGRFSGAPRFSRDFRAIDVVQKFKKQDREYKLFKME